MRNIEPDSDENQRASRDNAIAAKVAQHEYEMRAKENSALSGLAAAGAQLQARPRETGIRHDSVDAPDVLRAALIGLLADMLRDVEERGSTPARAAKVDAAPVTAAELTALHREWKALEGDAAALRRVISLMEAGK